MLKFLLERFLVERAKVISYWIAFQEEEEEEELG